jgi:hypothetical protein
MGESMENALRYHIEVDLSQENTSHAQLTGRNKQVLEVGQATGYVTKSSSSPGCGVPERLIDRMGVLMGRRKRRYNLR